MRCNGNYRQQVDQLTLWFTDWSECEQTVALYNLLKKLNPPQTKFLDQVLQQQLADCTQISILLSQANDQAFIAGLVVAQDKGKTIRQLLQLLPLLQAGNDAVKEEYLKLIPDLILYVLLEGTSIDETHQLLTYSIIHPAMTPLERSRLRQWLAYLEVNFTYSTAPISLPPPPLCQTTSSSPHFPLYPSLQEGMGQQLGNTTACATSPDNTLSPYTQAGPPCFSLPPKIGGGADWGSRVVNGQQSLQSSSSLTGAINIHHPPPRPPLKTSPPPPPPLPPTHLLSLPFPPPYFQNGQVGLHATPSTLPLFDARSTGASTIPPSPTSTAINHFHQPPPSRPSTYTSLHSNTSVVHGCNLPCSLPLDYTPLVTDWLKMTPVDHNLGIMGMSWRPTSLSKHASLSPQSSVTSSGSGDSHHFEEGPQNVRDTFLEEGSGMKDVPMWLKALRLHKYSYLFRQMTYEQMLCITEEWLEAQKVTKGARHKIALCIQKLNDRQKTLRAFEKQVMEGVSIRDVLFEMKGMLNSPVKAYRPPLYSRNAHMPPPQTGMQLEAELAEGDLPGQFVRTMGKVCTQLLTANTFNEDCLHLYVQLVDKCMVHEAFTFRQKSLLLSWKHQAQHIWEPSPNNNCNICAPCSAGVCAASGSTGSRSQVMASPVSMQQRSFGSQHSSLGSPTNSSLAQEHNSCPNLSKSTLVESREEESQVQSAPLSDQLLEAPIIPILQPEASASDQDANTKNDADAKINAHLDRLCISVAEHALEDSNKEE